jgi:hypothetical protein
VTRAEEFEGLRPLLFSIAYRILGSVSEAEVLGDRGELLVQGVDDPVELGVHRIGVRLVVDGAAGGPVSARGPRLSAGPRARRGSGGRWRPARAGRRRPDGR